MNAQLFAAKHYLNLGKLVMKVFGRTKTTRVLLTNTTIFIECHLFNSIWCRQKARRRNSAALIPELGQDI